MKEMEGGLEKGWWYRIVSDKGDFARKVDGTFSIKLLRPRPVKEYLYQGGAYLEVYREGSVGLVCKRDW